MAPATAVDERPDYLLDDELYEQAESGMGRLFRRFDDTQLTRFMWVAGDDIPVYDRSGGRFWGLYKDEVIRKRRLMPVRHARCLGINEYPALVGTAEQVAAPGYLAPVEAEGFERSNSARVTRPPRVVAYEIMGEYEDSAYGPALFEHAQLMGDDKKDLVLKLYRAIVPPAVKADPDPQAKLHWHGEGALKPQTRKGVKFLGLVTGIFLDQWVGYLTEFAEGNVRRANLSRHKPKSAVEGTDDPLSEHDLAMLMLGQMQQAAARAWSHQTAYLESSRDQIIGKRNGGKGKRWYDARDERYLLETGTVPLNLEEAIAASKAAEQSQTVAMQMVERIVERINPPVSQVDVASQIQRQVEESLGGLLDAMTPEQLQAILERKLRAQQTQEAPVVDPEERREQNRKHRRQVDLDARAAAGAALPEEPAITEEDDALNAPIDEGEE
jgi:hypothetical protein